MPGTQISFAFSGDLQLDRTLERIDARAVDAAPAFDKMGNSLLLAEQRQFKSAGGYGSGGWAPLSEPYATRKRRQVGNKPILVYTGTLRQGLTHRPFPIDVVEAGFAVFGTDLDYALYLQNGTPRMPARPVIDLPESIRRNWVKILQRWLITGVAAA